MKSFRGGAKPVEQPTTGNKVTGGYLAQQLSAQRMSQGKSSATVERQSSGQRQPGTRGDMGYIAPTAQPVPEPPVEKTPEPAPAPPVEKEIAEPPDHDSDPIRRAPSGSHLCGMSGSMLFENDEAMEKLPTTYKEEMDKRRAWVSEVTTAMGDGGLVEFAQSYKTFGLHYLPSQKTWAYAEWVPDAKEVYLMGDFNGWDRQAVSLKKDEAAGFLDVWRCQIDPTVAKGLVPGSKYKLHVVPESGQPYDCMPAWCKQVTKTPDTGLLDAVVPDQQIGASLSKQWRNGADLRLYEVHVGMAKSSPDGKGSFSDVQKLLPRIVRDGYNAIMLIGVYQFDEYVPLGGKGMNFFAPESRFGTSAELKQLVKAAHEAGISILMSLDHTTPAPKEDAIHARYVEKGARLFNYEQFEVLRFLLGNIAYWMEEFGFDGFRFQYVEQMLYNNKGRWPPQDPEQIEDYVTGAHENNRSAIRYLMLATELVRSMGGVTIADDYTFFPGLCEPIAGCGLGFHFRQTCKANEHLQMLLRTKKDEEWSMTELVEVLNYAKKHRAEERQLACTEAFEDCIVGRRPLRIAMLAWETLHTIAAGGVAPHVTELAADLNKLGHEVHIFTRSTQPRTWEHEIMGVWYHEVAFDTSPDFVREIENMCNALVWACFEYEGRSGKRFDLFHGHDWLAAKGIVQLKAANRPTIFTMHSTETGRCGNVAYAGQSARIRGIEGEGCHIADRVICVSGVLADEVKSYYGIHGDKIRVVYNGIFADNIINMEWQDDWSGNTKKDKGFDVMDPVFLFVGRLAVQKGPDLLIEAIPMILQCRGDAKFVIVGDGHMKGALEARVNQLGIGHAVCFTGSVKSGSAHLKALFKSCDAVVVPSRNEPFGIVVLEAWAAGKPVVATTCGGPRDFVTPGQDGFLVDPQPNSIAWGCCEILKDFEQTKRMGIGAQGKAQTQFSWLNIASQTHDIYYEQLSLLGTPACRRADAGCPLGAFLLGSCRDGLGVFDKSIAADRGLALHKLIRLLVTSFGDATLTCMGSEFGSPDSFDARSHITGLRSHIKYGDADEKGLRYKHLELFEACMNRTANFLKWNLVPEVNVLVQDDDRKVLAFARGRCLFAFNFHPCNAADHYKIRYPGCPKDLQVVLNTDDVRFNGKSKGVTKVVVNQSLVTLCLPARTAMVLTSAEAAKSMQGDKVLSVSNVDFFIDLVKKM
jgi:1,4-alpha-glucan branching enzyme/glycosyltransferase involved in cell wall biosynthesis